MVTTKDALAIRGYRKKRKLAPTLQGEAFVAAKTPSHPDYLLICGYVARHYDAMSVNQSIYHILCSYYNDQEVVIKTAKKSLHFAGVTIKDGYRYKVKENIVKEAGLMELFTYNSAPDTMIKYHGFFEDQDTFYLVMEKGGQGLFEFCIEAHELIKTGQISIRYWRRCVKYIFAKMCSFIAWMHNAVACCNLDISLENIVMRNDTYFNEKTGKFENLDIRFIDFGLTEHFNGYGFKCNKYVGKLRYKAPQVFDGIPFQANKADIWCLGVSLFMLSIGAPPFEEPSDYDERFVALRKGRLESVIIDWRRRHYVTANQFDLITKMLCIDERKRFDINDVIKHKWFRRSFVKRKEIRQESW